MRIQAVDQFNIDEMYTDLLTLGYYVFHDAELENLCQDIQWIEIWPGLYHSSTLIELDILKKRIDHHTQDFLKLDFVMGGTCQGLDGKVCEWHDDANQKIDLQFLCYQCDLEPKDGGALEMQCFDGITRSYHPRMGDVMIMNHKNLLVHRVTPLTGDHARIACSASYKYALEQ